MTRHSLFRARHFFGVAISCMVLLSSWTFHESLFESHWFQEIGNPTNATPTMMIVANTTSSITSSISRTHYDLILDELDELSGGPKAKTMTCAPPLVPFQNVIHRPQDENPDRPLLIPKILHVSMKSRCLPRDIAHHMNEWKRALPTYSIFFHDDEAVARLIYERDWHEFPSLLDAMKCVLFKGAMVIDVWRILLLYRYGGVYSDSDNVPLVPNFNETYPIRNDVHSFFVFQDVKGRLSHWFFATEAKHPVMQFAIEKVLRNILNLNDVTDPRIMKMTGPDTLKWAYHDFLAPIVEAKNGTNKPKQSVWDNDVLLMGLGNRLALKMSNYHEVIEVKYKYKEIVPFNETLNVTRKKRISMDGGVKYWPDAKRLGKYELRRQKLQGSCKVHLEKLKNGEIQPPEPV